MDSVEERARTFMDSTRDHRHRVAAAAKLDEYFDDYEIQMTPEEALSFAATAPIANGLSEAIYVLIDVLNHSIPTVDFGSNHPRTGRPHHRYWVGRRHGDRVVVLELFRGFFAPTYSFDELTDAIRSHAEKAQSALHLESDENGHRFTFLWPTGARA